ncbi:MAG: hypothetical protein NVS4B3_01650 [Gemmatimonadaceae bacterium]
MTPREIEILELTFLALQREEIHGATIDPRRRPRLKPGPGKPKSRELLGEVHRGWIASAPPREGRRRADVEAPAQKGSRRDDDGAGSQPSSFKRFEATYAMAAAVVIEQQLGDGPLHRS